MRIVEKKGVIYSNLNRSNKWLGIIEYKSIVALLVYIVCLWLLTGFFTLSNMVRIYIEVIMVVPLVVIFYTYLNEENMLDVIFSIIKYLLSPKIYVYMLE